MNWPFGRSRTDDDPESEFDEDLVVLVDATLQSKLVVYHDPRSYPAEQYRTFRTNLCAMNPGNEPRSLMFTSAGSHEGKSTTVANIALSLAEFDNLRVCLIDFDLRAPSMHELFGLPRGPGITDVLLDRHAPDRVLQPGGVPNLSVITAGRETSKTNDVVASDYMQDLLGYLKSHFHYILVDTPPTGLFVDASHLSTFLDGVILVVSLESTARRSADAAMETLQAAGANVVGTFVTGTKVGAPTVVADVSDG